MIFSKRISACLLEEHLQFRSSKLQCPQQSCKFKFINMQHIINANQVSLPWHYRHYFSACFRDDDVVFNSDTSKAAVLIDPFRHKKSARIGISHCLIQQMINEVTSRLNSQHHICLRNTKLNIFCSILKIFYSICLGLLNSLD